LRPRNLLKSFNDPIFHSPACWVTIVSIARRQLGRCWACSRGTTGRLSSVRARRSSLNLPSRPRCNL
jgi:hypothetical protein